MNHTVLSLTSQRAKFAQVTGAWHRNNKTEIRLARHFIKEFPAMNSSSHILVVKLCRAILGWRVGSCAVFLLIAFALVMLPTRSDAASPEIDFTDAIIYEIGAIPFQTVWYGRETKFRVRATALGAGTPVVAGYVNPPSGVIHYEGGNFYYKPGESDKAEFTVTFSAVVGGQHLEQIVPIQPIPLLPPEKDILGVERKGVSDPASRDYLVISDVKDTGPTEFNHHSANLRTVTISGKEVVLRAGHANRLFESYNGNPNIREFRINAEKLVIASPFYLPSSKIVIRARELEFQDIDGTVSFLSTEPPAFPITPGKSVAGANGLQAGDMDILVGVVKGVGTSAEAPIRFVLRGGAGQNGGPGDDGKPGKSVPLVPASRLINSTATQKATCTALVQYKNDGGLFDGPDWYLYLGPNKVSGPDSGDFDKDTDAISYARARTSWKPTSGGPATPAGRPGNGGLGGRIRSNSESVIAASIRTGGAPGTANSYRGGAAGTPTTARFYQTVESSAGRYKISKTLNTITTTKGADAPALVAGSGSDGGAEILSEVVPWFSSKSLRQIINHAKDAYLNGELDFARAVFADNLELFTQFEAGPEWELIPPDEKRDYQLIAEEMRLYAHRLASGLDRFGNPPGWVPLLSLEASKLALEQEIDRSIGILYLEYWLTNTASTLQDKLGALADARQKLANESEQMAQDYEAANSLLPELETRVISLELEVATLQNDLKVLEGLLLQRAEAAVKGPVWRRVARGLGTICKFVPVPIVQAVGVGLDITATFDPKAPWDSIEQVKDVVTAYREGEFDKSAKDLNTAYKKIKFPDLPKAVDPTEIKDFIDDLQKASKPVVSKLKAVQNAFEGTQAPKSQIEAELAKLKAESKEFNELGNRVSALMSEKESFIQQVAQTIQLLGELSGNITGNLLAIDALNEGYAQAAGALDDRATIYIREIGRRARERLLLYHYYVKKAYEYRLLKPYPEKLNLQSLMDRIRSMAESNSGSYQPLTADEFRQLRSIYDDALGEVIKAIVVEYTKNAPSGLWTRLIGLTAGELEELNAGKPVDLNLANVDGVGLFPSSEENIRIANVRVHSLTADPLADPGVSETLDLNITHTGISTLTTSAGGTARNYHFLHYTHDTEVPVQWGASYRLRDRQITQLIRSPSNDSLLAAMLNRAGTDPRSAGYFTWLGGLAELRIDRLLRTTNQRNVRLTEVVLEIEYEFTQRSDALRILDVVTSDGLAPYIELSSPDASGKKDALGSFRRSYRSGANITLSVPERIGNLRFASFVKTGSSDNLQGMRVAGGPRLFNRQAVRAFALNSAFDGKNRQITLTMSNDRRVHVNYEPVPPLELSIQRNPSEFLLNVDGERYTPFRIEESNDVLGPWVPLAEGLLMEAGSLKIPQGAAQKFYRINQN